MSSHDVDPVHRAVMKHSVPDLIEAIAKGGDINAVDREGRTPLFYAATMDDPAVAAELVRRGANVNVQDTRLETPLHFAARAYQLETTAMLLKNGASVDARDAHGNTPLSHAVFESKGRGQIIELLLSSGANKDLKNKHGVSPKELAKSIANYDVRTFLV